MKVSPIPLITIEGKVYETACKECDAPARVKYDIGNIVFSLCAMCILLFERKNSKVLADLLSEKEH